MIFIIKTFILLFFLGTISLSPTYSYASSNVTPSLANKDFPSVDQNDLNKFCQGIIEAKKQHLGFKERVGVLKDALFMSLVPSAFAKPKLKELEIPSHLTGQLLPEYLPTAMKNIIFTPGPTGPSYAQFKNSQAKQSIYKDAKDKLDRDNIVLKKLLASRDLKQCQERALKWNFNYADYIENLKLLELYPFPRQELELNLVLKQIARAKDKFNLNWEIVPYTTVADLHQKLKSIDTKNIVIVSHGRSNGTMVDSQNVQFPQGLFSDLSPNLLSLTFFTCHSDKIVSQYTISNSLTSAPSAWKQRLLYNIQDRKSPLTGAAAPISGLRSYLKKLDKQLSRFETSLPYKGSNKIKLDDQCEARFSNFTEGELPIGLHMNRQFIGYFDSRNTKVEFPCRFLNRNPSLLVGTPSPKISESVESFGDYQSLQLEIFRQTKPGELQANATLLSRDLFYFDEAKNKLRSFIFKIAPF